jgi:hypothetical protein
MKKSEMKTILIQKNIPMDILDSEISRIRRSAMGIAKDADVPVEVIIGMILERIKYVGSPARP